MAKQERFVLKLANNCECKGCARTLKELEEIYGVDSTFNDPKTGELTIWGPVDPETVMWFLEKNGKKAKLVAKKIRPKRNNCNDVHIELSVSKVPQPVVQDSNDQNLVEQVQKLMKNVKGFKELEVTHLKTVKSNGKNKDKVVTKNKTRIKVVMDDVHYHGPGTGISHGGPDPESAIPWQGNYFSPAGYEPSARPFSGKVWFVRKG